MTTPSPDDGGPDRPTRIGYALTAAWMVLVLVITGGDPDDPWFRLIFIVPLAGWVVAATARHLRQRRRGRQ